MTVKRRLTPVPHNKVKLTGGLWKERSETNREITLPVEYQQCKSTGRLDAFKLKWKPGMPNKPHIFWGSDVAKWIEAVGFSQATDPDTVLKKKTDEVINWITKAQQPDGYLNTYFTVVEPDKRWTNLRDNHELYGAGHMMEAAVAYYEGTGNRKLLDAVCRYADYIGKVFGPKKGQKRGYPGHQEIELALVKLYRAKGKKKYLDLAAFFINERGQNPNYFAKEARERGDTVTKRLPRGSISNLDGCQAHLPVREQKTVEGHAVRAAYMYAGMADVAAETGDVTLLKACKTLWKNLTERRMYIHGGIGSTRFGERFTFDYDLPNEDAYAETCAAIALVFFAHRMLNIEADGQYADVMERALYNNVISGVSQDGKHFFYDNLLASVPGTQTFKGQKPPQRAEWFGCACCPPNIARLLASIGGYMYSQTSAAVYVHIYGDNQCHMEIGGRPVTIEQKTAYPWKETVNLKVSPEKPAKFTVALRIPGWCRAAHIAVNGKTVFPDIRKGYAMIKREWNKNDNIALTLAMPVERIEAHPSVRHDVGRVALQRGPIVYCLEEADNGKDLNDIALDPDARLSVSKDKKLGVPVIKTGGKRRKNDEWKGELYRANASRTESCKVKAIPYFLWANRGEGEMLVWIRQLAQ